LGTASIDEIKRHPWFKGIDWDAMSKSTRLILPP